MLHSPTFFSVFPSFKNPLNLFLLVRSLISTFSHRLTPRLSEHRGGRGAFPHFFINSLYSICKKLDPSLFRGFCMPAPHPFPPPLPPSLSNHSPSLCNTQTRKITNRPILRPFLVPDVCYSNYIMLFLPDTHLGRTGLGLVQHNYTNLGRNINIIAPYFFINLSNFSNILA